MKNSIPTTIRITREFIDIYTNDCVLCFEVLTQAGNWLTVAVPRSDIAQPHKVLPQLAGKGWTGATNASSAKGLISQALQNPTWPTQKVTCHTGWVEDRSFVLPHTTFGADAMTLQFTSRFKTVETAKAGSLMAWNEGVQKPCLASSYLTFASALAMAGALMHPLKMQEGVIFQLTGKSSSGKTMALRLAQSAVASPDPSLLLTHDLTDRALEEHLGAANDGLLCIDELARLRGTPGKKRDHIKQLPHVLASGVGRARSKIVELDRLERKTFRVIGFSTGELPLESYGDREEGERVRFPDIPVPPPADNGIFDRLSKRTARELAEQTETTIAANYGIAYEAFVKRLVESRQDATEKAQKHLEAFVEKVAPDGTSWERRFAQKFGIVYAAAALASEWGILPFSVTHARNCICRLHKKARIEARTPEEAKEALVSWLSAQAAGSSFPIVKKGERARPKNGKPLRGFTRGTGAAQILAVLPEELRAKMIPGRYENEILRLLEADGLLKRGSQSRLVTQIAIDGFDVARPTFYCFDLSKLPSRAT